MEKVNKPILYHLSFLGPVSTVSVAAILTVWFQCHCSVWRNVAFPGVQHVEPLELLCLSQVPHAVPISCPVQGKRQDGTKGPKGSAVEKNIKYKHVSGSQGRPGHLHDAKTFLWLCLPPCAEERASGTVLLFFWMVTSVAAVAVRCVRPESHPFLIRPGKTWPVLEKSIPVMFPAASTAGVRLSALASSQGHMEGYQKGRLLQLSAL